jgi:hypothetical protein
MRLPSQPRNSDVTIDNAVAFWSVELLIHGRYDHHGLVPMSPKYLRPSCSTSTLVLLAE